MIFHTATDPVYYKNFYYSFRTSIEKYFLNPKFSLRFVGEDNIDLDNTLLTIDKTSFEDIKTRFNATDKHAKGYYALSRWLSIPIEDEHVVVCDADVLAVNTIDKELILNLLDRFQVINVTRLKKDGRPGGMMIMILHKDICQQVRNYSNSLLDKEEIEWATDVNVRTFLYRNFSLCEILQMEDISKVKDFSKTDKWFIFSKIRKTREAKIQQAFKKIINE